MTIRISTFLYFTLFTLLIWPTYIGARVGIVYLQPFKFLVILFLFLSILNFITRPSHILTQIQTVFLTPVGKSALLYLFFSAIATVVYGIDTTAIKFIVNSVLMLLLCLLGGFYCAQNKSSHWPLIGLAVIGGLLGVFALIEYCNESNYLMQFAGSAKNEADAAFLRVAVGDKSRGAYRAQATFIHPLVLAQFLIVAVPFIYLQCTEVRKMRLRVFWYCLLFVAILGCYFTGSRAAFGVILLYIAFYILGITRYDSSNSSFAIRLFRPILTCIVLIIVLALLPGILKTRLDATADQDSKSTLARLIMLERTVNAIHDRPIWGWGPGTAVTKAGVDTGNGETIDCFYMSTGVERGVPALLLLILLQLTVVLHGFKRWLEMHGSNRHLVAANTVALLGFFLISAILSIDYLMPLAFFLIGIQSKLVHRVIRERLHA